MFLDSKLGSKKELWMKILTGYSLWTSSSILSPVQTIIFGPSFSASGNAGFESQRTVMATVTRAVSLCVLLRYCYKVYLSSDTQDSEMGDRRVCSHTCPSCRLFSSVRCMLTVANQGTSLSTDQEALMDVRSHNGQILGKHRIDYRIQEGKYSRPDIRLKPEIVQPETSSRW